jgi:hypothetical protein
MLCAPQSASPRIEAVIVTTKKGNKRALFDCLAPFSTTAAGCCAIPSSDPRATLNWLVEAFNCRQSIKFREVIYGDQVD